MVCGLPARAVAQGDSVSPEVCDAEAPIDLPIDSGSMSWEYNPPAPPGTAHLGCAGVTLDSIIHESPGNWGIAVRDLRSRETLIANPDQHFVAGSLYKLGVAAEAYARIDAGGLAEESLVLVSDQDVDPEYGGSRYAAGTYLSVQQALQAMITESDNRSFSRRPVGLGRGESPIWVARHARDAPGVRRNDHPSR